MTQEEDGRMEQSSPIRRHPMSREDNTIRAKRWFDDVWNHRRDETGDAGAHATVNALLARPCYAHMEGGDVQSPEEFIAARSAILGAFPDLRVTVEGTVAEGDDVVVRWSARGTHLGDGLGVPASSRSHTFRGMTWLRFVDGRIIEGWDHWNQGKLLEEMKG
jgi:steroid delta-isomerase-like uncharacterized protein